MPPKKGDVVEVLVSSRNAPRGMAWTPATIEFIDDKSFPSAHDTAIRIRTLSGDRRADLVVYRPWQIRRVNLLVALAVASSELAPAHSPYTDTTPKYASGGLADGPQTKEREDPRVLLDNIVSLDMARLGETGWDKPKKVHSPYYIGRGRRLLRRIRGWIAWLVNRLLRRR